MCVYVCLTGLAPLAGLSGIFLRGRGGCRRTIKLLRRSRSCLRLGIALIRYTQAAVRIYVLRVCERERVCVCRCDHPSPFFARGCTHSTHTHNTRARARAHTHRNTYTHTHTIYIYIYIYIPGRLPFWWPRRSLPPWQTQMCPASCRLLPTLSEWRMGGGQVVVEELFSYSVSGAFGV